MKMITRTIDTRTTTNTTTATSKSTGAMRMVSGRLAHGKVSMNARPPPPQNSFRVNRRHPQRNEDATATPTSTTTARVSASTNKPSCASRISPLLTSWTSLLAVFAIACLLQTAAASAPPSGGDQGVNVAPPQPHTAALAAPGGGGSAASSILEQFSPNCTAVTRVFVARGIDRQEIPQKPSNEMGLHYCESPSVGTCCTYSMETKMAAQSRNQLENKTREHIIKMSTTLAGKAQRFNEIFGKLLSTSREEFHRMFTRTYGVIYQQNSYVFSDLFKEFEAYYEHGRVDLVDVMDKFFNLLYQKMFEVLNVQYSFDKDYILCVSEHMKELKPFGDVPDKLSLQVKRSFVATRTYGQALAVAADVAKKLVNVRLNPDCMAALTKMQHCGACKGYSEKPCTNYCVNVIKGCLHYFNELDIEWENFVTAMDKLSERLLSSFNIVNVVEPINIKISEAIMNFQDNGPAITNRVFKGCGTPKLGRSKRSVSPKFAGIEGPVRSQVSGGGQAYAMEADILDIDATVDEAYVLREKRSADPGSRDMSDNEQRSGGGGGGNGGGNQRRGGGGGGGQQKRKQNQRKNEDNDLGGREQGLEKMIRDIRQRVKESKKFWLTLPQQLCSNSSIASSSDVDGMCWNGHTIDRYMHSVTTEHGRNPEFPDNPASPRQTQQVSTQLHYLKNAINHLRTAYAGKDVDWAEHEELHYGSGSGAGSDNEDDEDDTEGSGMGGGASPFEPTHKQPDGPVVRGNEDDEDSEVVTTHSSRPGKYPGEPKVPGNGPDNGGNGVDSDGGDRDGDDDGEDGGNGGDGGLGGGVAGGRDPDVDEEEGNDLDRDLPGLGGSGAKGGSSSGGSGSNAPQKMSLRRALMLYLVPLYMAWFGGLCAELL